MTVGNFILAKILEESAKRKVDTLLKLINGGGCRFCIDHSDKLVKTKEDGRYYEGHCLQLAGKDCVGCEQGVKAFLLKEVTDGTQQQLVKLFS